MCIENSFRLANTRLSEKKHSESAKLPHNLQIAKLLLYIFYPDMFDTPAIEENCV